MSKIVILIGSMRKGGNTELLANAFARGAKENNEVEIISVAEYKVNPCIGCNSCFTREGNKCFQNDDMIPIYEKLKEADMVAIASPVYFYGLSAELKAVIDRLHTPLRNEFNIKKLVLILVGAATLPELFDSIIMQYKLVLNFFHLEDYGMVLVRGAKDKGEVSEESLNEAYILGASIK
ncbi:MAG: flavodoxin family protein [Lachnospiraceae bacterium]|nr:flavodoxin family protein [Lachnospiraceae bacterium]